MVFDGQLPAFAVFSAQHREQLLGGDDQQPEGQVRRHLHRPAHPDVPSAVVIVQVGVDPLSGAALAIANSLGRGELTFFAAAGVVVDEGDVCPAILSA